MGGCKVIAILDGKEYEGCEVPHSKEKLIDTLKGLVNSKQEHFTLELHNGATLLIQGDNLRKTVFIVEEV